ncbi:MAG: diadenylate cyclase [Patescibacteria group bacterium]
MKILNFFLGFGQNVSLKDIIDMAIIATFIYLILVWFKKARARFMFFGMAVVGLIYVLARFFGLYLTTMVFQAFFAVTLIMILIIFQDDIRYFFERIGIWRVSRSRYMAGSFASDIDILSSALAELSRKKIGALVVIQGQDPLERHIEAGIGLDGLLSQVLLGSIFEPGAASHDGAVIIGKGRIVKFGCHLPLSVNIKEIGRLGTRHAAALGLAERTDAMCIVVSEEHGTVSVAELAKMRQLKEIAELQGILDKFYRKNFPGRDKNILVSFLTEHFFEKIIAIILACGLGFAFGHRVETIRRDFVVPIEYRNLSPDVIIKEPKAKEITVTLSGFSRAFNLLNPRELKISFDMAMIKDGETKFIISKDMLRTPSDISIVEIQPDEINFTAYRMVSLVVPVELKTKGRTPGGVVVTKIEIFPKEVAVTAPSIIPRDKISISMEEIDLKSITRDTTIIPKLIITPEEIHFPENKYPEVKVIIEVQELH